VSAGEAVGLIGEVVEPALQFGPLCVFQLEHSVERFMRAELLVSLAFFRGLPLFFDEVRKLIRFRNLPQFD
jgi:hypothetical protein